MAGSTKMDFFASTVKQTYEDLGYSEVKVIFNFLGRQTGVNYLGDIVKVDVNVVKDGKMEIKKLIIKTIPEDLNMRKQVNLDVKFNNEVAVYGQILPLMDDIQKKFNIENVYNHCKVLKVHSEEFKEMILMEDLMESGFEQSRTGKVINDFDHVASVVTKIGKMHALSLALEKHAPGKIEEIMTSSTDDIFNGKTVHIFLNHGVYSAIKHIQDPNAKEKASNLIGTNIADYLRSMVGSKIAAPYSVLTHSDIWTNNILFKYDGSKLVDSIILDWQIVRYHSPAFDILFFLFTSVDDDIRGANFMKFLNLYYTSVADFLVKLNCDPVEIFPEQVFKEHLSKFLRFTMASVFFMLQVVLCTELDVTKIDFKDFTNSPGAPQPTEVFIKRVNAIVNDLLFNGLL